MNKVAIVFWSGSGNTEKMASCIAEGVKLSLIHIFPLLLRSLVSSAFDGMLNFIFLGLL